MPSPKAFTDLICHTNHASECYSRIFQPTEQFQTVRDDQELPPGLHVRINLATGVKEARLNVLDPEDTDVYSDLTVVENPEHSESEMQAEQPREGNYIREGAHQHPLGSPHDVGEGSVFSSRVAAIRGSSFLDDAAALLPPLEDLKELSHSYHWGLTVAEDETLMHKLFQFLLPERVPLEIRSMTAILLGTALHNNPAALNSALSHFYNDEWPQGPLEAVIMALIHEKSPSLLSRIVFLLSSLCQDRGQLARFLESNGTNLLIQVFHAESAGRDDRDRLRGKIANFVLDRFLQSDSPIQVQEHQTEDQQTAEPRDHEPSEWVVVENIVGHGDTRRDDSLHSWKSHLSPWIPTFSKSIEAWGPGTGNTQVSGAMSSVNETYNALLDWQSRLAADVAEPMD